MNKKKSQSEWRRLFRLQEVGVYYALIFLMLLLSAVTAYMGRTNFLNPDNIVNVLYQSSLISIMAVAMTVILITGNFDLSVASVAALSGVVLIAVADSIGFWPGLLVAMCIAVAAGVLNGTIVQFLGINAFIVTLGTLTALRGLVLIVTDGQSLSVSSFDVNEQMSSFATGRIPMFWAFLVIALILACIGIFRIVKAYREHRGVPSSALCILPAAVVLAALAFGSGTDFALPKPVIYMFVFAGIVWFVLTFSNIGRRIYAVGGNAEAARLAGINVLRYKLAGFVLSSAAAGFAGILFASRLRSISPNALQGEELTVIAAAILGGTSLFGGAGSVIKTLTGALLLYTLTNGFNILNLGANYQGLIEGVVIVTSAALYSSGNARNNNN